MDQLTKRTWAEIDLENIVYNMKTIRKLFPKETKFLGVVKANAYGHGSVAVARALEMNGADYLAVACMDEAIELRNAGIQMPILILGYTPPEYTQKLIMENLTQTVFDLGSALKYDAAAKECAGELRIHLKIDTGMSRLGFLCTGTFFGQSIKDIANACSCPHLKSEGIFTHFSVSDMDGQYYENYTRSQYKIFTDVIDTLMKMGITFSHRHCSATGAVLNYPEMALDMVRPGLLLYGYGDNGKLGLKPCMRLYSRISAIKTYDCGTPISYGGTYITQSCTRMGVVGIGYADGLFRNVSNRISFHVENGMAPQRGRICMDMCMIDVTEIQGVEVNSVVEIFGEHVSLEEYATVAGTIPYELLCAVSKRVPRVYK